MKLFRFACLFVAVWIGNSVMAQSQRELQQLMRNRGEYYFTLSVDDPSQIQELSRICSVDGTDGRNVVAYANQQEYDRLIALGYQLELQTPPSLRANVTMWNGQGTYNWDSYLTYPQYVAMMEGFPDKAIEGRECTLFSLGTLSTTNLRQLLGVRINNGNPEGKPKFLYTSTMHGDEITGMILMLRLIDELCTSTDSRIVNLVNDLDIYIMPLTNPDGTYKGGNNTVNSAQRYNGHNIDLNRNYKDYYQGAHPDGNSYEDETVWTMAFGDSLLFTMSANYHGGAEVMNYPWDAVYDDHADKDWYEYVCTEYVRIARQVYSSYMSDTYSDGVTSGAAWYVITGSRQDYMNAYGQCREVTVECSSTKTPAASQLPNFWNYNHNSMLAFMEQCRNGVHGVVRDADTGLPIEGVKVTVLNHDSETSFVTTHSVGDFHRPIKGGSYTFEFRKSGYCTETVDVTITDGQRVDLTVNLGHCEMQTECYNAVTGIADGTYIMGHLEGDTLYVPGQNSSNVTSISATVEPNINGFSVEEGTTLPQVTLTAYRNNGQYYISYNGRYLALSSSWYGTSLTWSTSSNSSSARWNINENGIYVSVSSGWSGSTNYYLYCNNGSFALSTMQHNNITFYQEGDCPTVALDAEWNWWTPTVAMTLGELETLLGDNAILINSQNDGFVRYDGESWSGTLDTIVAGQMYRILTTAATEFTLSGEAVTSTITFLPGYNWFGYTGSQSKNVAMALGDFTPTEGDTITAENGTTATFTNGSWDDNFILVPGHGYVYHSNAQESRNITFE
ncbi:MAG: carboxypeptidase regulatory-like domain-containing protein [Bacteroidales bacterium]|nr:carboxypeptidase regulatory-like domain-containing protein [Bacteroidales bacterium]MBQ6741414.1 carboxypeptidase regulatory-like domain-containing protein [Bacteroidales bacterium]